jgi:hypothetical protein
MTIIKRKKELEIEYKVDDISQIGNTILVTAGPSDFAELQKSLIHCNEAMVAIGVMRMKLSEMATKSIKLMIRNGENDWEDELERMTEWPEIEFRCTIDLTADGLLIDGEAPGVWIHLGHGDVDDSIPIISTTDDGADAFITVNEVLTHLKTGKGKIWMVLMPVCHGNEIAEALESSDNIVNAWGSQKEQPYWSWGEIINFINQITSTGARHVWQ